MLSRAVAAPRCIRDDTCVCALAVDAASAVRPGHEPLLARWFSTRVTGDSRLAKGVVKPNVHVANKRLRNGTESLFLFGAALALALAVRFAVTLLVSAVRISKQPWGRWEATTSADRDQDVDEGGGPQRTGPTRRRAAEAVLVLATLALVALSWWSKRRCLVPGAWRQGRQYTDHCYTDLAPLWFSRGLDDGTGPWGEPPLEYPVLLQAQAWVLARLTHLLPGPADVAAFLDVAAVLTAAQAVLVLLLLRRAGHGVHARAWWAAAPALGFYALYNWDLLPVLLLVAAVVAHREGRDGMSGALAGLGAAAKLFPGFLVPLVVLGLLRQRRADQAVRHASAAAVAWAAVNVPVYLEAPGAWRRFWELNSTRSGHVDSLWQLVARVTGWQPGTEALNVLGPALLVVGALGVVVVGVRRLPPDRTWELVLPLLVVFLLTNKVFSPQYFLWLVPLMVLCRTPTAPFLAAVLADVAVFSVELPVLGGRAGLEPSLPYSALAVAVALRAAALLWVAAEVLRGQSQESNQSRRPTSASGSAVPVSTG